MRDEVRGARVIRMGNLVWVEFRRLARIPSAREAEGWPYENGLTEKPSGLRLLQRPPNKGLH